MELAKTLFVIYFGSLLVLSACASFIYKNTSVQHRPILYYIWALSGIAVLDMFVETGEWSGKTSYIIRCFADVAIIMLLAFRLEIFRFRSPKFWVISGILVALWIVEHLVIGKKELGVSWFDAASYLAIVMIAVEIMTRTVIKSRGGLLKNPVFVFSVGLIFFYSLSPILDLTILITNSPGSGTNPKGFYAPIILGIITNIIYFRSILCIPSKTNYSFN